MKQTTNSQKIIQTVEKIELLKKTRSKETQEKVNGYLFQISKDLERILEGMLL